MSADPFLRLSEDFCLFTTSWLEELKLSEACRFMAGMLIFGLDESTEEVEESCRQNLQVHNAIVLILPDRACAMLDNFRHFIFLEANGTQRSTISCPSQQPMSNQRHINVQTALFNFKSCMRTSL